MNFHLFFSIAVVVPLNFIDIFAATDTTTNSYWYVYEKKSFLSFNINLLKSVYYLKHCTIFDDKIFWFDNKQFIKYMYGMYPVEQPF